MDTINKCAKCLGFTILMSPFIGFIVLVSFRIIKGNPPPRQIHPITITAVPLSAVEVSSNWKMGDFVVGYRIVTDEYVIISGYGGLFGQNGEIGGPGAVDNVAVRKFVPVFNVAKRIVEQADNKESITFYGDLLYKRNDEDQLYLSDGKKVVLLFSANYNGNEL